ncbi:hypothetical protein F3Y22_tig00112498pilonHSYRG00353 [Hibiscus syriacus]|uniref:Uncharacterized protein n=1 Tax=Hibiscus syriacus TaxID=106335 RepID=A0A6A2Y391_HIBSY|nr:hypothetical protein F3Y22_tig00112498pilonHSYRG00353 [Hibiscus syriacus]
MIDKKDNKRQRRQAIYVLKDEVFFPSNGWIDSGGGDGCLGVNFGDKRKMPDTQALVIDFINKLKKRRAKQTAELLRSVISQTRVPYTNHAAALIQSVKAVGERLIAANPVGTMTFLFWETVGRHWFRALKHSMIIGIVHVMAELAVGNVVRHVLHIIREEDLSLTAAAMSGLNLSAETDYEDDADRDNLPVLSAAAIAAASKSTLRPPSLQTLLEDVPETVAVPRTSGGDSEGKSKCELSLQTLDLSTLQLIR